MANDVNIWELITKPIVKAIIDLNTKRVVYKYQEEKPLDISKVDFSSKAIDPNNVVIFDSGSYRLTCKVSINDGVFLDRNETIQLNVYKNGLLVSQDVIKGETDAEHRMTLRINDVLDINAKDKLAFKLKNTGAISRTLENDVLHNYVIIERV